VIFGATFTLHKAKINAFFNAEGKEEEEEMESKNKS
jgi:hypothetical protein